MKWRPSDLLVLAVRKFEGMRLSAYKCPSGVWTIGYGHTPSAKGATVTAQRAEAYLDMDLEACGAYVHTLTEGTALTQGMFDALTDFVFNLGPGNLAKSTLLKRIKRGPTSPTLWREYADIPDAFFADHHCNRIKTPTLEQAYEGVIRYEFSLWVYSGKNKLNGLIARRDWEADRYFS